MASFLDYFTGQAGLPLGALFGQGNAAPFGQGDQNQANAGSTQASPWASLFAPPQAQAGASQAPSLLQSLWGAPAAPAPNYPGIPPAPAAPAPSLFGSNRQALVGLGLGLMGGTGTDRFGQAQQGYARGAALDEANARSAQQYGLAEQELAYRAQQDAIANKLRQQQFSLAAMTDAQRAANDLGLKPGSDERNQFMTTFYRAKIAPLPTFGEIGEDPYHSKIFGWRNPANQTTTAAVIGSPQVAAAPGAGATFGTPGAGAVPFVGGAGEMAATDYPQPTATAPAATPVPGPIGSGSSSGGSGLFIAGPGGTQIEIPKNVDPKIYRDNVTRALADAAAGKITEQQSKDAQYASRMAIASQSLNQLEQQGTQLQGNILAKVPFLGNYAQTPQYQEYQNAKSQFVTALLRKESGAAIAQHEFDRYDKELFPQPGDKPNTVEQKRQLRDAALANMARGAGPGYQLPAVTPRQTPIGGQAAPTSATTRTGGAAVAKPPSISREAARQELIRRGLIQP